MGSRYNYFEVVTVDVAAFPTDPQSDFGFFAQGFSFVNRGAAVIEYSFDGTNVHGDLNNTDESVERLFVSRMECKVWFRVSAGSHDVRVEAWGGWGRT